MRDAEAQVADTDLFAEWFSQFLNDRQTRNPSAHTMKAYRPDFIAIATLVAGGNSTQLAVTDITKDSMRSALQRIRVIRSSVDSPLLVDVECVVHLPLYE